MIRVSLTEEVMCVGKDTDKARRKSMYLGRRFLGRGDRRGCGVGLSLK